jgi:ankyrin repeat protein
MKNIRRIFLTKGIFALILSATLNCVFNPTFLWANDINAKDEEGNTALHKAVKSFLIQDIRTLLDQGADPNVKDSQGRTPLMYVGIWGDYQEEHKMEIAKLLVEKGSDVNAVDSYGDDVLTFLTAYNLPRITEYLISQGAKVDHLNSNGRTALSQAAENGKIDVVRVLLQHGADPNLRGEKMGWSALDTAIHYHHQDIVEAMMSAIKPGADSSGLITSAREGNVEMLQMFIGRGVDLNLQDEAGMTALLAAIDKGHEHIVRILLDSGSSPELINKPGYGSLRGETALCMASRKKLIQSVRDLLAKNADVDAPCGAVIAATQVGSAEIVKLLAEAGADMQDRFTGHWHALHLAAEAGNVDIARIVLEHGTPVDMRDNMDSTALMIAAGKGHLDMIRLLFEHQADLEAVNTNRPLSDVGSNFIGTPLMWAVEYHQNKAVELLLSLGAKDLRK